MDKKNNQKGSSMIEVLVTVFILAVGLLGLASMQMVSIKNINNSQFRSLATSYAYDMAERMRANRIGVSAGNYNSITTVSAADPTCTSCSSAQIAQLDSFQWGQQLSQNVISGGLPSGAGSVSGSVATSVFDIQVTWDEQGRDSSGGTIDIESFTLTIQL